MRKVLWSALLVFLVAVPASAFDGHRKGFILGGGVGVGATSFKYKDPFSSFETDSKSDAALVTNFQIGYGPGNQFLIFYFSHLNWSLTEDQLGGKRHNATNGNDVNVSNGILGVGVSHYLKPLPPCFMIAGGLGLSVYRFPIEDDSQSASGFGIWGGAGYEFAPHWIITATIGRGTPSYRGTEGFNSTATTFGVAMNFLAY